MTLAYKTPVHFEELYCYSSIALAVPSSVEKP